MLSHVAPTLVLFAGGHRLVQLAVTWEPVFEAAQHGVNKTGHTGCVLSGQAICCMAQFPVA